MEEKVNLSDMHLATARLNIDTLILSTLLDADKVETAMTKTEDGYIYEVRYKNTRNFIGDAVAIIGMYEKLENFITLDKIAEQLKGWAHHVGRLADKIEGK